jgi:hypothetical protein
VVPSLGSHMARARIIAERLRLAEIEADRGAFYLGASAPDIRVITRLDRRVTHFYDLDEYGPQDSTARMLDEHPRLKETREVEASRIAFIAGYITHLVLDECYIEGIYRPEFGHGSHAAEEPRRNVLDRALQYELDRRDREDREAMREIQHAIACSGEITEIPFIDDEHLIQWREVAADVAGQAPDYSRFRRMMTRHLAGAGLTEAEIDTSCEDPATLVREAFEIVTEERIEDFWEEAGERMHDRVRKYLR